MRQQKSQRLVAGRDGLLEWGTLTFATPILANTAIPYFEITAARPGPRLAVIAGMHPNEVSSMEAALRLSRMLSGSIAKGSVAILPVLNMPGLYLHADTVCPIDGKNINFCFPGSPDGTFSEALADALVTDWSIGADLVVDLHGGDLREEVAKFVMCQLTGDAEFDAKTRRFARCYDADLIVEFPANETDNAGRAVNVLPKLGRFAVMSEAGANGRIDEESVAFHLNGVLDMARELGLIDGPKMSKGRRNRILDGYRKILSPATGRFYRDINVNDLVEKGQRLAFLTDIYGSAIAELRSPTAGRVVMAVTHAIVEAGDMVFGVGAVVGE
jgi:predicted deacylase